MLKQKLFFFPNVSGKRVGCAFPPSSMDGLDDISKECKQKYFFLFLKIQLFKKEICSLAQNHFRAFFNELC